MAWANCGNESDDHTRIHELPDFAKNFDLEPGADLDSVTEATFKRADEAAADRQPLPMPTPPPGVRPGSAAWRIYREECYQSLQLEVKDLRFKLREYFEQKRQESLKEIEDMKKAAGMYDTAVAKKPPASTPAVDDKPEDAMTA